MFFYRLQFERQKKMSKRATFDNALKSFSSNCDRVKIAEISGELN